MGRHSPKRSRYRSKSRSRSRGRDRDRDRDRDSRRSRSPRSPKRDRKRDRRSDSPADSKYVAFTRTGRSVSVYGARNYLSRLHTRFPTLHSPHVLGQIFSYSRAANVTVVKARRRTHHIHTTPPSRGLCPLLVRSDTLVPRMIWSQDQRWPFRWLFWGRRAIVKPHLRETLTQNYKQDYVHGNPDVIPGLKL